MLTITVSNNHFKHRYKRRSEAKFNNQYFENVASHSTFVHLQFFSFIDKHPRLIRPDIRNAFYISI